MQNIPVFLFHLWIGTVHHGENFLIIETSNNRIEQDLGNTENAVEHSNQTVTAFLLVNATCDFTLSSWPRRFAKVILIVFLL